MRSTMALALLLLACCGCASQPEALPQPTRPPTSTPDAWEARGAPARISIPAIGVDAAIEALDLAPDQRIGVPRDWANVGWYREGVRPGEAGRAVLSGHYDDDRGQPAVFARLAALSPGDELRITYADGSQFSFAAGERLLVSAGAVDAATWERIFGTGDRPMLSLITCDGYWDPQARDYSHRLVVFAEAH